MKYLAQIVPPFVLGLGLVLGSSACKKDSPAEGAATKPAETASTGDKAAAPAVPAPAAELAAKAGEKCTEGATRCQGSYAGKVRPGNNAPAGAQVEVCKAGAWTVQQPCDAAKNLGCYAIDDPATNAVTARCLSAMDAKGE